MAGNNLSSNLRVDATVDAATEWMRSEQSVQARIMPRRVIVLNWTNDVEPLVEAFADFSPPGSEVVFVHQQQQQCKIPKKVRSVRFRQVLPLQPARQHTVCCGAVT